MVVRAGVGSTIHCGRHLFIIPSAPRADPAHTQTQHFNTMKFVLDAASKLLWGVRVFSLPRARVLLSFFRRSIVTEPPDRARGCCSLRLPISRRTQRARCLSRRSVCYTCPRGASAREMLLCCAACARRVPTPPTRARDDRTD